MKHLRWILPLLLLLAFLPGSALAQTYLFSLDELYADVYINSDGSVSLQYEFAFTNDPGASPIDFVDVGMPTGSFDMSGVTAQVDGVPVSVSRSDYQGDGSGFAVVLGAQAIPAGQKGRVQVFVPTIRPWLRYDSAGKDYASFVFSPLWFGRQYVQGTCSTRVSFHLPPGVKPEEPRWHAAPSGFSTEPMTSLDAEGRVTYTWGNPQATAWEEHDFGASFPAQYVPASAVSQPSIWETLGISEDTFFSLTCCGGVVALIAFFSWLSSYSAQRRKLQYLPPKIAVEGMGIKRGLTAVEAAVLLEQPLDKILTMILFAAIKKNAARVVKRDPLHLEFTSPPPAGLQPYETDFLKAFKENDARARRKELQSLMVDLVKSVSAKLKGFSRKETLAYYRSIVDSAWKQVETAQTPEVRSAKFDEVMEWTMLDRDYDDRTRDVFRTGPVYMPTWWGHYDPTYAHSTPSARPLSAPSSGGQGGISLPTLPGATFAASMVNGVQNFSSGVIGNLTEFTSGVTKTTNPVPVSTSSGSRSGGGRSGGGGCACACACAGCACACAGGGR